MPTPDTWFDQYIYMWLRLGFWGFIWVGMYVVPVYVVVQTVMTDKECRVKVGEMCYPRQLHIESIFSVVGSVENNGGVRLINLLFMVYFLRNLFWNPFLTDLPIFNFYISQF